MNANANKTALLVMDVQEAIVARVQDPGYVPRVSRAVDAARSAGIPVVYVTVGFRSGRPEASARNKIFGALPQGLYTEGDPKIAIHAAVAPRPDEVVVTKRRVSAFAGSDLDVVLRSGDITHLVLTGVATSGVVLSTLRQAADLDFRLTVLSDACYDPDPEVHRLLTERVFPSQAEITTVEEWAKTAG
ncbi:cysteine hydrolase family protein [Streptomyces rugosispiralis]|uniref:Cysteine hydrolase n=1 Tax=Streptomyces rugosispiralis TaxID=2967341 RepID=A0ABT1UV87_9ACTN|nr:isochorismatase family cysteine hydrolase [Streptomyces rugosispiralis]MCQ8189019.1 cysteine hydrolase [Streptomyces rugosispiralis]